MHGVGYEGYPERLQCRADKGDKADRADKADKAGRAGRALHAGRSRICRSGAPRLPWLPGDGFDIRLHECRARLRPEEYLGRVVGQHDLRVQQAGVLFDEGVGGRSARGSVHEVAHGEEPRARQGLVILAGRYSVMCEEGLERIAHEFRRAQNPP